MSDNSQRILGRFLVFCVTWFLLTGTDLESWILGIPAVLIAVFLSLKLAPSSYWPLSLTGALRYIPYFLHQSVLGGFDVMRRALSPHLPINPGLVIYETFLPTGAPRILFVNTISLLPGTLSADLQGNIVTVHTIDQDRPVWRGIQNLEWRIAALFKLPSTKREEA